MSRAGWCIGVILCLGVCCSGCIVRARAPGAATAASERSARGKVRFTQLVPVAVRCGDNEGTPLDGHMSAVDGRGEPVSSFSYSPGQGVVIKSYAVGGLPGGGHVRVYAPEDSCSGLSKDVVWVTARAANGETAEAQLPVTIGHDQCPSASTGSGRRSRRARLMLADFEAGTCTTSGKPVEEWYSSESCRTRFMVVGEPERGQVLRLVFDNAPAPHYSGVWFRVDGPSGPLDATGYRDLRLEARGSTPTFAIELKDAGATPGETAGVGKTVVSGVDSRGWSTILVPLARFAGSGGLDFRRLTEMSIVFEDSNSAQNGELLLDNIALQ